MSKKPKRPLTERLKPFVAPFRFDGSGEFHLKLHKSSERGGLDKNEGEKIIEANPSASAIFRRNYTRTIAGRCS